VSAPDTPVLSATVLEELAASVGEDRAFVAQLIDAYLTDSPAQLEAVESAVTAGDTAALVPPAHTLKSSSATLGAQRVASEARALEMAGRAGSIDEEARSVASTLRATWDEAAAALRAWTAGEASR
jgi:HPt (histidine-containing phosphotransfer) domain-containing protein